MDVEEMIEQRVTRALTAEVLERLAQRGIPKEAARVHLRLRAREALQRVKEYA